MTGRLAILFVTLLLLCGDSHADLDTALEQVGSTVTAVGTILTTPVRVVGAFLGLYKPQDDGPLGKSVTSEVRDGSDLITIIKHPQTQLDLAPASPSASARAPRAPVVYQTQKPTERSAAMKIPAAVVKGVATGLAAGGLTKTLLSPMALLPFGR